MTRDNDANSVSQVDLRREIDDLRKEMQQLREMMERTVNARAGRDVQDEQAVHLETIERQSLLIGEHLWSMRNTLELILQILPNLTGGRP